MAVVVTKRGVTEFERDDDQGNWPVPGRWRAVRSPRPEKRRYAVICCPGCSTVCAVGNDSHKIAPDGAVSPSVACETEGCGFHEHIKLVGWVPVSSKES